MIEQYSAEDISLDIIDQVEQHRCLLFVGSGVSIPAQGRLGPPGPALLALELADRMGSQLDEYELPWVAQLYADREGLHALRDYVRKRLYDVRYQPTLLHHLITELPFRYIVYTAQDILLLDAFNRKSVSITPVFPGGKLSYSNERVVILLYGNAQQPETLLLTEDERRQVFDDHSNISNSLRVDVTNTPSLFLGYSLSDPTFREFYYDLRQKVTPDSPRAYLVGMDVKEEDLKYWQQHNASVIQLDADVFLQKLIESLRERGSLAPQPNIIYEELPLLSDEERSNLEKVITKFSQQFGLNNPVESGDQLHPIVDRLNFMHRLWAEHRTGETYVDDDSSRQSGLPFQNLNAQIQLQMGNAEWVEENLDGARGYFEEAIRLDPNLSDAYYNLYYVLIEKGELADATVVYTQIQQRIPDQVLLPEHYEIQRILGQTALGVNYCVLDKKQAELVTITIFRRAFAHQMEAVKQMREKIGAIRSKRISRLFEFERFRGRIYVITEWLDGHTLREKLGRNEKLSLDQVLMITDQVAEGLEDGHRHGEPNLALQPDLIVLATEGVKLINYGFSRFIKPPRKLEGASRLDYQSPEQIVGETGDEHSDIYALGTILYEMLTSYTPGVGSFQLASEINPEVDEAVDVLIAHARDFDPNRRFRTIAEMRKEIQRISYANRSLPKLYLRLALSKLSGFYAILFSKKGLLILPLIIALFALVSTASLLSVQYITRLILLLFFNSLMPSIIYYYLVRGIARQQGLGSIISSGRAMGASLSWLFTIYVLSMTGQGTNMLAQETMSDFVGFIPFNIIVGSFLSLVAFFAIQMGGWITTKLWNYFVVGFYTTYLALGPIILLLAWAKWPPGFLGQ